MLARLLYVYQRSGLQSLARATGILRLLGLADREKLLPPIDRKFFFSKLGRTYPAVGPRRARVALFAGCMAQVSFSALHEATIRVLTANGCEVVVPAGQTCCGALAAHAGVRDVARSLARKNLDVFLGDEFDAVITNAAGCGSTLKEYEHLFAAGHAGTRQGARISQENARRHRVSRRSGAVPRIWRQCRCASPIRIPAIFCTGKKFAKPRANCCAPFPGLELVEMAMADYCCGSAGSYNVTETQTSLALLAEKMKHARATNAPVIVTANPGCLLQMRAGAEIHGTGQEVVHVMELLDRALIVGRASCLIWFWHRDTAARQTGSKPRAIFSPIKYRQPRGPICAECTAPAGTSQRSPAPYVRVSPPCVSVISPSQDDVRRLFGVRVVGIKSVRSVLPNVGVEKSFLVQLAFQGFLVRRHFLLSFRNSALRLAFHIRAKHSAGNARDHPPRHHPHRFPRPANW